MVDELETRIDQLVVKNWHLIEHLARRRQTMIDEVLKAAHEAFSQAPEVKLLVEAGASRCEPTRTYFGISLNNPVVESAATIWAEVQTDTAQLTFQVYSSFKGNAVTLEKAEVKDAALAKLAGGRPAGWDDSNTRTCTVSEIVTFAGNSLGLDAFARQIAETAIAQLRVAEALAEVVAANPKR